MFGPLPALHRAWFVAVALLVCVGAGAWLAQMTPLPLPAGLGAVAGGGAGLVAVWALLHDWHRRPQESQVPQRR